MTTKTKWIIHSSPAFVCIWIHKHKLANKNISKNNFIQTVTLRWRMNWNFVDYCKHLMMLNVNIIDEMEMNMQTIRYFSSWGGVLFSYIILLGQLHAKWGNAHQFCTSWQTAVSKCALTNERLDVSHFSFV